LAAVSNLTQRVAVAVVFGPLLLALLWIGGIPFLGALCAVVGVGTWEFYRMQEKKGLQPWTWFGVAASLFWCICAYLSDGYVQLLLAGLLLWLLMTSLGRSEHRVADVGGTLLGTLYVGFLGSYALRVRNFSGVEMSENGAAAVAVLILLGIWASDTAAYFSGRWFGRRHPFPNLSPGKTDAGFVGAVGGAVAVMMWGTRQFALLPIWEGAGLGLLVGLGAPAGDLVESMIKRDAGVKDASGVIPGHGGVLDRFDSFLFVYPLAYLYLFLLKAI